MKNKEESYKIESFIQTYNSPNGKKKRMVIRLYKITKELIQSEWIDIKKREINEN